MYVYVPHAEDCECSMCRPSDTNPRIKREVLWEGQVLTAHRVELLNSRWYVHYRGGSSEGMVFLNSWNALSTP